MSETLFTEKQALEGYTPRQLTEYILEQSERISEAERMMMIANDVLSGYGTTIDEQLEILRNENTETTGS